MTWACGRPSLGHVHYKYAENRVAIGMEGQVERATGRVRVTPVICAHDCRLMINPDCVRSKVEGHFLKTLSRALFDAIGVRLRSVPLTPAKLKAALQSA